MLTDAILTDDAGQNAMTVHGVQFDADNDAPFIIVHGSAVYWLFSNPAGNLSPINLPIYRQATVHWVPATHEVK
jgi:hypothetical protein